MNATRARATAMRVLFMFSPDTKSFAAERDERIDARGSSRGDVAGDERHRHHHCRHASEGDDVQSLDAEQERLHVPRESHGREHADEDTQQGHPRALPDEHSADRLWFGTKGHAYADLLGAARDAIREHAVQT